jgi:hypothetical protein
MQSLVATKTWLESTLNLQFSKARIWPNLAIVFSLGLWAMLWLSISPGDPKALLSSGSPAAFANNFRAIFPLIAAGVAGSIIGIRLVRRNRPEFSFVGPLGLAAAYGLVGLAATLKSPDASNALWWATLYLSVPVVLWCVIWNGNALDQFSRLVNLTWAGLILITLILFVVALLRLDLLDSIASPSSLLRCDPPGWIGVTGHRLRETGVGRFAAISGIVAIGALTQGKLRPLWSVLLLISFILLLSTGARGSFAGFFAGASLVILIYLVGAGKIAMLRGVVVAIVFVSALWGTGLLNTFLDNCVLRSDPAAAANGPATGVAPPITPAVTPDPADPVEPGQSSSIDSTDQVTSPATQIDNLTDSDSQVPDAPPASSPFFTFTGRTKVWRDGWDLVESSPFIGLGFNSDRLLLGTHMHNSVMQTLVQAGILGTIPFVGAVVLAWFFFFRLLRNASSLPNGHKHLVIQCGGVLAFLTLRSFPESTGAFFGIDWLILALVLFYLQVVNYGKRSISE